MYPEWATKKVPAFFPYTEKIGRIMQLVGAEIVRFSDRFMGQRPKEALYRLPRLLAVGGKRPTVADNTFIAPSALVAGDVHVGRKNYIGYNAIVRCDAGESIYLGESCSVQEKAVVTGNTTLGKWVVIEPMAIIESADIASNAFIGANAVVMRGARVESNTLVCACAVVQAGAVVPSGEVWAGNPAQRVGLLEERDKKALLAAAKHQVLLAIEHRDSWEQTWEDRETERNVRESHQKHLDELIYLRRAPFFVKEGPRNSNYASYTPRPAETKKFGPKAMYERQPLS